MVMIAGRGGEEATVGKDVVLDGCGGGAYDRRRPPSKVFHLAPEVVRVRALVLHK
jgi:hypothetical protein